MTKRGIIKFVLAAAILVVALLAISAATVYYKQKEITQWAIEEVNKNFEGRLQIADSQLSLFHDFPYLDVDLKGVVFYTTKDTVQKPLYEIDDLYIGFRWLDILQSKFDVKSIDIKGGHLDIVQFSNGDINLLLAKNIKSDTTSSASSAFQIHLKKLVLEDFKISFRQPDSTLYLSSIRKFKLSIQSNERNTQMKVSAKFIFSLLQNNEPTFFHDKKISIESNLAFDALTKKLSIAEGHLGLEEAMFSAQGSIGLSDTPEFDLKVNGEKPDFSLLTALAPPEAASIIARYDNQGSIFFEGTVKGKASAQQQPELNFIFGCSEGRIQNREANKGIDQLGFKGSFTNGAAHNFSTSVFELKNFSFRPARGSFRGDITVRDFTNPQVALRLVSDLDLDFLAGFLQIKEIENLKGNVKLSMNFSELIDVQKPENTLLKLKEGIESELIIQDLSFFLPKLSLTVSRINAHAEMKDGRVTLDSLSIHVGNSDITLSGMISDLPALFHRLNKNVSIRLGAKGNKLFFRELLASDTSLAKQLDEEISNYEAKLGFETSVAKLKKSPLPQGEFFIHDLHADLKGYPHTFHDMRADIIVTDTSFQIKDFSGEIDQSDFHFNGRLVNYALWFDSVKRGNTRFEFDLNSKQVKLHNLLTYKGESYLPKDYQDEVIKDLKLHGFTDLYFDTHFKSADLLISQVEGRLRVHPLKVEDLKGRIHFEDEHLSVQNLSAKMGSSDFNLNLTFYTGKSQVLRKRDNKFSIQSSMLNLDELLNFDLEKPKSPADHAKAFNIFEVPFTDMSFSADINKIRHHHVELQNFQSQFRMQQNHFLYMDTLRFATAGGIFAMNGYFNGSDSKKIYLKSNTRMENLNIDQLFLKFDNFGQDFMVNKNLHGQLSGSINSLIHVHPDLTPILNDGEVHLDVRILNGSINDFAPLQAMSSYFKDKNINKVRFDTLQNRIDLKNGVLTIPAMTINSSLGFIEMEGTQTLDLKMDYLIRVPLRLVSQVGFQALFGGKKKEEVDPDQVDAIQYRNKDKRVRFLNMRIKGTPQKYDFSLGK